VLAAYPQLSSIGKIISDFGLLPNGIPSDITVFLPDNEAVDALLAGLPLPGLTVDTLLATAASIPALASEIVDRLIAAILYHIHPQDAATPAELVAEGTIITALPDYTLTFGETPAGYTVTDTTGAVADASEPVMACGSAVYIVNKVLMPAELLSIPKVTLAEAICLLGGCDGAPTPAPASED